MRGAGEGRIRPRKWEQYEDEARWCAECRTYTEHDPMGCVDCGIREDAASDLLTTGSADPKEDPKCTSTR